MPPNLMVKLFRQRKQTPAFRNGGMTLVDTGNPHLFAYMRGGREQRLLIINNFSEIEQVMKADKLAAAGMTGITREIFNQTLLPVGEDLVLDGYRYLWIDISGQ